MALTQFIGTPAFVSCEGFVIPASPQNGGPGTAYIEQTIDQTYFAGSAAGGQLLIDLSSTISQNPGFYPQCIEIVNPCCMPFTFVLQAGGFVQRNISVPAGYTVRRKIVYPSMPFQMVVSWGIVGNNNNSPFIANANSHLRIRVFNFPMNDEDVSMWHHWGPASFDLTSSNVGLGLGNIWPVDNKCYKITRMQCSAVNGGGVAQSFAMGFYSPIYNNAPTTFAFFGMATLLAIVPPTSAQEFTLFEATNDTDGILIGPNQALGVYNAVALSANAQVALNIQVDSFDQTLGQPQGLLT